MLHECLVTLPHEDFVYVGDTGRFPYGQHSLEELRAYSVEITTWLEAQDVKLVVVACNSATAAALPTLQRHFGLPIIGVVTPEARAAVQATRSAAHRRPRDRGDGRQRPLREAIGDLDAGVEVIQVACPGLADRDPGRRPLRRDDGRARARGAARRCAPPRSTR